MSHDLISEALFSREGSANYLDKDLILRLLGSNTVRDGHYHDQGTKLLLLEDARTNLFQRSEEIDNAYWTKQAASVTANATVAPDGVVTADKVVEDSTTAQHGFKRDPAPTLTDNVDYAFSVFAKAAERSWIFLRVVNKAGATTDRWFNLSTGVLGSGAATATIQKVTSGFYRCVIRFNAGAGVTTPNAQCGLATGDAVASYAGNGTSGVYVWGAQLEASKLPSSYIQTVAVSASRGAESLSWVFSKKPQALTIYLRLVELGTYEQGSRYTHLGDQSDDDPSLVLRAQGTDFLFRHTNVTSVSSQLVGPIPPAGAMAFGNVVELRAVLFPDGAVQLHASLDGAAETSGAKSAALALATSWGSGSVLYLNGRGTFEAGLCGFHAVKVARGVQTRAYMRTL